MNVSLTPIVELELKPLLHNLQTNNCGEVPVLGDVLMVTKQIQRSSNRHTFITNFMLTDSSVGQTTAYLIILSINPKIVKTWCCSKCSIC